MQTTSFVCVLCVLSAVCMCVDWPIENRFKHSVLRIQVHAVDHVTAAMHRPHQRVQIVAEVLHRPRTIIIHIHTISTTRIVYQQLLSNQYQPPRQRHTHTTMTETTMPHQSIWAPVLCCIMIMKKWQPFAWRTYKDTIESNLYCVGN